MDEEITITMTRSRWVDLLIDLDWLAQELGERANDDGYNPELEPGSSQVIQELHHKGVNA